ncbi:MAG TPA: SRPBCC family protein [Actinomycetales bacterium]|nr:SRPBCC family protein [Actinomycetales bacterium]
MADDTYTVERSVAIEAPPARVYEQVADFHHWTSWSPWEDVDPDLRRTYSGAESGTGAIYAWSGNRKAGQGRMEIIEATEPSTVRIDLVFEKPFKARNDTVFAIQPEGSGSRVTWSMTGKRTLATKMMGVFKSMDSFLGPDFEKGLARLKATAEKPTAS